MAISCPCCSPSPPPPPTGCCPASSLPDTFYVAVSNIAGCDCLAGTYVLNRLGTTNVWGSGPFTACGSTLYWYFYNFGLPDVPCLLGLACGYSGSILSKAQPDTVDCDTETLVWNNVNAYNQLLGCMICNGGSFNITMEP